MAVIEVSEAGGNSNENGAYVGGVQPKATDDLLIPASAGAFKVPTATTLACRSLEVAEAWAHEVVCEGTGVIAIGGAGSKADKVCCRVPVGKVGNIAVNFVGSSGATEKVFFGGSSAFAAATIAFVGTAGTTYVLEANMNTGGGAVTHTSGGLTVNIEQAWGSFNGSNINTRTLNIENVVIKLGGTGTVWTTSTATNLTLKASGSTIWITDTSATGKSFVAGTTEQTYGNLKLPGGASIPKIKITQSVTLNNLEFTEGQKVLLEPTKSITIKLNRVTGAKGTSGNKIVIESATAGTAFTLEARIASSDFIFDFCTFKDVKAVGTGCNFYAGANSTNVSNNTNLKFEAAPVHEHTLSASQGQEASRVITPKRTLSASQGQSITRSASPTRVLAASQAQSISEPRRAITRILSATGVGSATVSAPTPPTKVTLSASQGQSAAVAVTLARTLAASQSPSATVVSVPTRTLVASQGQSISLRAALVRLLVLSATQTATVTLARTAHTTLSASQGQAATIKALASRALATSQAQGASLRLGLGKALAAPQGSSAVVGAAKVLHVALSASQGSSAVVLHGQAFTTTLAASQTSSASVAVNAGRQLGASQGQVISLAKAVSKVLSSSTGHEATVVRSLSRALSASTSTSASASATKTHGLSTSQGSSAALQIAPRRTLRGVATASASIAGTQPAVAPMKGTSSTGPSTIALTTVEQTAPLAESSVS